MTRATAAAAQVGTRFRQRKLSTRVGLQVVREHDLDFDADQQVVTKFESGVEKAEETEHHLQVALSTQVPGGKEAAPQIYIPTPEIVPAKVSLDQLYTHKFSKPATYIRYSSTVEDCNACPYNMCDEDDVFLKEHNARSASAKDASTLCSEDQFEEVMYFFETTAAAQLPLVIVGDYPPVLSWIEMHHALEEDVEILPESARVFAKDIYEHWRSRREKKGNTSLQPQLKVKVIEALDSNDDNDPYVCFRRREARQVRKTRGRDAQSAEKLKKLRKELEDARHLVGLVKQREVLKGESLAIDKLLFEQRTSLKAVKKILPEQYKDGDEDLLINQRVQKKKAPETNALQQKAGVHIRLPPRPDGRQSGDDLVLLRDVLANKENAIDHEIKTKITQHQKWNENYVDLTRAPLTPPLDQNMNTGFRPAVTEYLPTPPASVSSDHSGDAVADVDTPSRKQDVAVRYSTPCFDNRLGTQPAFRRRTGRGGRVMIDRRGMQPCAKGGLDPRVAERFKYDDDEDEEAITHTVDPFEISSMRYRAAISGSHNQPNAQAQAMRRAQLEQQQAQNSQLASSNAGSSTGP